MLHDCRHLGMSSIFFPFISSGVITKARKVKVVYSGSLQKSLVRVFCEETLRFACQSGSARLAKMAGPAMLSTEVGPGMALHNRVQGGTYRGTARQVAAGSRGRRAELVVS